MTSSSSFRPLSRPKFFFIPVGIHIQYELESYSRRTSCSRNIGVQVSRDPSSVTLAAITICNCKIYIPGKTEVVHLTTMNVSRLTKKIFNYKTKYKASYGMVEESMVKWRKFSSVQQRCGIKRCSEIKFTNSKEFKLIIKFLLKFRVGQTRKNVQYHYGSTLFCIGNFVFLRHIGLCLFMLDVQRQTVFLV